MSKIIVLMGAPGAGKGTQARLLQERLGLPQISTGDIFRALAQTNTPLAEEVRAIQQAGCLIPDDIVIRVVEDRTALDDCRGGYVLDAGVPGPVRGGHPRRHLLRRHALDGVHRPLVVFTPKSMLRLKAAVSPVEDFISGRFASVFDDPMIIDRSAVRRVLLCSGKISYELHAGRQQRGVHDIAIVRIEQLYPMPQRRLAAALDRYPNATDVCWVQEEPANQGAWPFYGLSLPELMPERLSGLRRISRRAMAAPSAGSAKVHDVEQRELIAAALDA